MYLSEYRFTDGNLIVLYAIHRAKPRSEKTIPEYIKERIKLCFDIYKSIMASKPDRHKTMILIVASGKYLDDVKNALLRFGIDEKIIAMDSLPRNVTQCFDRVINIIKSRRNPPYVYFIGSFWLRDIYDSVVSSKMKGFRVQFEGASDHRPIDEVDKEKALDAPK